MTEKALLRMRYLREKRENKTITEEELKELEETESKLTKSPVCRDLSEEYTIAEIWTLFD